MIRVLVDLLILAIVFDLGFLIGASWAGRRKPRIRRLPTTIQIVDWNGDGFTYREVPLEMLDADRRRK